MTKYNEALALEIAIINLLTAIQKGKTRLDDEIGAVSGAMKRLPNWRIEVNEE